MGGACSHCTGGVIHHNGGGDPMKKEGNGDPKKKEGEGGNGSGDPMKKEGEGDGNNASANAPATLIVNLPADAQLTIGGKTTSSTSARRVFTSPTLQRGKTYSYTLKATVMRNGKEETVTKEIDVAAGRISRITLAIPAASSVAAR